MSTKSDLLSEKTDGDRLQKGIRAFEEFLKRLKITNPSELVLINPQQVPEEVFDVIIARNRGYYAFPPVGLLNIAAVAKQIKPDIQIHIIDLNFEILKGAQSDGFTYRSWEGIVKRVIENCRAPFVGITCMFGATKPIFLQVSKFIRKNFPDVPLLSGGVQATYDYQELLRDGYSDVVFRREAEKQFESFLVSCIEGSMQEVPWGIAFKTEEGVYDLGTPPENVPVDWDIRSFYSLIDALDYHQYGSLAAFSRYNGPEKSFATVLSNRGCRACCTFCTVRDFNGFSVRQRPVRSVIEEVKFLVREKGIRQIDWLDDDLLWNPERTVALFKGLAEEIPELEWICNNGLIAAAITDEIMYWMVQSGMKAFKIGIESGNDEMLHLIKKPTTKEKLREKRRLFRKYPEVFVSANFIIGFPRETFGQMMDTFDFASELEWDWSSFYICQPLKGTEMFSVWQSLGDERTEVENYDKTLNPGRAAARGEFGYPFKNNEKGILTGRDIFKLPRDKVPGQEQIKEIWFTFNLVVNFLDNLNFKPGGNTSKILRWFESIAHAYPYDASMAAALARGYRLLGNQEMFQFYQRKFEAVLAESGYWRRRVQEFPELLDFAEVPRLPEAKENRSEYQLHKP